MDVGRLADCYSGKPICDARKQSIGNNLISVGPQTVK